MAMTKDEALIKIATVNAMDYEYQAWAREALANDTSQERVDKTSESVHKPMHPQLKAMLEEYFDKCFAESAPQRTWVGLTDDEMQDLWDRYAHMEMMRAIEAKLKEKNT